MKIILEDVGEGQKKMQNVSLERKEHCLGLHLRIQVPLSYFL